MITVNKEIQKLIAEMKENRVAVMNYKDFEICISKDTWTGWYHVSLKDEGGTYIYESSIKCGNDVMLYKNIEMVLEYLG